MPSVYIEGLDDCLRCLEKAPQNVLDIAKSAMRDASKATAKQLRQKTPKRWRRLIRYKVFTGQVSRDLNALVGAFNPKHKQTGVSDWFKAYWKNYGTLKHRDPQHHFQSPVKRGTARRRNNEGQFPENFWEQVIPGWEKVFFQEFQESMKRQQAKLYDR